VSFKIDVGFEYLWSCYGSNTAGIGWEKEDLSASAQIVYDIKTHMVYEMSVWDNHNQVVLRWRSPRFKSAYNKESRARGHDPRIAFDQTMYTETTPKRCLSLLAELRKRRKNVRRV